MPFFSIIVPCYNHAHWLGDAVQSVLDQGFQDWELIIVNDGSVDHTFSEAEKWVQHDSRIRAIHQQNQGLSAARNAGMALATGTWFNCMDADDAYLEGCLEAIYTTIQNNPDIDLAHTGFELVDEQRRKIITKQVVPHKGAFFNEIAKGNIGPPMSVFIHRSLAEVIGPFDPQCQGAADWDYWLRAAKAGGKRVALNAPLVAYRHVATSMSRDAWHMYEDILRVVFRVAKKDHRISIDSEWNQDRQIDPLPAVKQNLIQSLGLTVMQGKIDQALHYFQTESIKYHFEYTPIEFGKMNSYLSFRDWYRKEDVARVMNSYPDLFKRFFARTSFSSVFQQEALFQVFKSHEKGHLQFRYGSLLGNFIFQLKALRFRQPITKSEKGYSA